MGQADISLLAVIVDTVENRFLIRLMRKLVIRSVQYFPHQEQDCDDNIKTRPWTWQLLNGSSEDAVLNECGSQLTLWTEFSWTCDLWQIASVDNSDVICVWLQSFPCMADSYITSVGYFSMCICHCHSCHGVSVSMSMTFSDSRYNIFQIKIKCKFLRKWINYLRMNQNPNQNYLHSSVHSCHVTAVGYLSKCVYLWMCNSFAWFLVNIHRSIRLTAEDMVDRWKYMQSFGFYLFIELLA